MEREELEELTKDELMEQAQDLDIEGRSGMNKDELVEAILDHSGGDRDELLEKATVLGLHRKERLTNAELKAAIDRASQPGAEPVIRSPEEAPVAAEPEVRVTRGTPLGKDSKPGTEPIQKQSEAYREGYVTVAES
jgi:hypothetical protein